ncbi:MAG: FAD-binding oxidoreductase [Pseudomonadota bacterium]
MAENEPVTIVGAGIVGICCALSLQEKGLKVRLIDPDDPGQGTSMGNAGIISPWSCIPQSMPGMWKQVPKWLLSKDGPVSIPISYFPRFIPWGLRFLRSGRQRSVRQISAAMSELVTPNIDLYRRHLTDTGCEYLLRPSSYVFVSRKPQPDFPNGLSWDLRRNVGAPMRRVSGKELREMEPALSVDFDSAIVLEDQARAISPGKIGQVLAEKVQKQGGIIERFQVLSLKPQINGKGWIVKTTESDLSCEKVVLAAGAWSARLLSRLGIKVPLEAEGGYHTVFKSPGIELNNSISDLDYHIVCSSMESGLRTAGTAEFAGLNAEPNYQRAKLLIGQTKAMFPDLNTSEVDYWRGVRPSFPDSLPAIGEIKGLPNLFAAFGHSHYGLGMAPKTGQLIAELVSGGRPNCDMSAYDTMRFSA